MEQGTVLSVFVDESGRFQHLDVDSRFYIIGMVFHEQGNDISQAVDDFRRSILGLGLDPDVGDKVEFAAEVHPRRYMLFQLADLICTLYLVASKIKNGEGLTESEYRFFGGPSAFRRAEAKFLAAHALV